jgi:ABC-type transport system involved in cytochrome c biogenesis permease component
VEHPEKLESLTANEALLLCGVLMVATLLYLLPSFIAFSRGHNNRVAIAVLNVLVGWTFLGWVGALVWALTKPSPPRGG